MPPSYPPARALDLVDDYHGTPVADPYRWLENADSPETRAWVDAQNALTRASLDGPSRGALVERLTALYAYPHTSVPVSRGGRYFYVHHDGRENQEALTMRDAATGRTRRLVDPNRLAPDGTLALTEFEPDDGGRLVAYALSRNGSDRQDIFVHDVDAGADRPDRIQWTKFVSLAWTGDSSGFFYTRFPEPGSVPEDQENYFCRVCFHRLGDAQSADRLVFERPDDPMIVFELDVTDDGRWLVITARHGASDRSEIWLQDLAAPGSAPAALITGFDAAWHFAGELDGTFYFLTDAGAPRGRLVALPGDGGVPSASRQIEIVAESDDRLSAAAVIGRRLVVVSMRNAVDRIEIRGLSGAFEHEVALPGPGSVPELSGRADEAEYFIQFTSFTRPPTIFRGTVEGADLVPWEAAALPFDPSQYRTEQVWVRSRDGTRVPMFLVHRADLPRDGKRPVLLRGYGGFNISLTPGFVPGAFVWLDHGGVFAVANLRGGGEFGEGWHEAGMLDRKQNVFDDFIACAEWLVANGWTRSDRLAIEGGSNGGLLVGAVLVQRPDLFGAVVCRVPVADMLRYHLWTVGRFWIAEYGCADNPDQFRWLYRYSPYHNVRDGVAYPPTLVMTADTDDRVSPGMAKKFAARLQAATRGDAPILIRVETRAGHGVGKSVVRKVEEEADIYEFLVKELRMEN